MNIVISFMWLKGLESIGYAYYLLGLGYCQKKENYKSKPEKLVPGTQDVLLPGVAPGWWEGGGEEIRGCGEAPWVEVKG